MPIIKSNYKRITKFSYIPETTLKYAETGLDEERLSVYLQFSFEKAVEGNLVVENELYAYYNTGLTVQGEDVYALFIVNKHEGMQKWCLSSVKKLASFFKSGELSENEIIKAATSYDEFDISFYNFAFAHDQRYNNILTFFDNDIKKVRNHIENSFKKAYQLGNFIKENDQFMFSIGKIDLNSNIDYCVQLIKNTRLNARQEWFLKGIYQDITQKFSVFPEQFDVNEKEKLNFKASESHQNFTLLALATATEYEQLKLVLKEHDLECSEDSTNDIGGRRLDYLFISKINTVAIFTGKSFNCTVPIVQAILKFKPKQAIFTGTAFGFNVMRSAVGTIIISSTVWDYESARISENDNTVYRGYKLPANSNLINLYNQKLIRGRLVREGEYACGMKVVDCKEYREDIKEREPEVLAGDQESFFFAHICNEFKVNWIVIKGISDYAYGKMDDDQADAAYAAIEYTIKGLGGF